MKWNPFKKKETFLCAKYDYKMDIAVKQEEAFADGKAEGLVEGIEQGSQQKAIEAAKRMLIKKYPFCGCSCAVRRSRSRSILRTQRRTKKARLARTDS